MPEKWTGELVGKMHNARVTMQELGQELGVGKPYISMILNGRRNPPGAKERLEQALDAIIERRLQEAQIDI